MGRFSAPPRAPDDPARGTGPTRCLVYDLGAGSGRAMVATYHGGLLALEEIHRFGGYEVERDDGPHWDWTALLAHVDEGLRRAQARVGQVDAIGVDSWGLDYVLLDEAGAPVCEPHHYRHPRSLRGRDGFPLDPDDLFARTGAQDLAVNTVYQLHDEARRHPSRIGRAHALLMIADAVNHHLTGALRSNVTLARTSGLIDVETGHWSVPLRERLGLPGRLFRPMIAPGRICGLLRREIGDRLGWDRVPVISVAAHDTASAVAALPLGDGSGFLICGSWSLIGLEQQTPVATDALRRAGFGIEGGVEGRSFLVKSLSGLHLIQKLRDALRRRTGTDVGFGELSDLARAALRRDDVPAIDPSDPLFFNPDDMVEAVGQFLDRPATADPGRLAASVYKGLAAEAGRAARAIEDMLGRPVPGFKLGGGGARDDLFRELLAGALARPLGAGPVEASAWGNAMLQLVGLGRVSGVDEGRRLIERSAEHHNRPF